MRKWTTLLLAISSLAFAGCTTPQAIRAHPADPQKVQAAEAGFAGRHPRNALCLSGGGYRAMLFNAGAVLAIEHKGLLSKVDAITSVSGGSILNGKLAIAWPTLRDDNHVRWLLESKVIEEIQHLADNTIDVPAVAGGILRPFTSNSAVLAGYYDKYLYHNISLADLPPPNIGRDPQTPIFIFQTTDLASGRAFFFSNLTSTGGPGRRFKLLDIPLSAVVASPRSGPVETRGFRVVV
jgi:NTE family protein